jgi:hypothetical protein
VSICLVCGGEGQELGKLGGRTHYSIQGSLCLNYGKDSQGCIYCIYCNECASALDYDYERDDFNFDANREKGH